MSSLTNPGTAPNVQLELFRTRLKARLFIIFIFIIQGGLRIERVVHMKANLFDTSEWIMLVTFAFIICMIVTIIVECLLYRKLESRLLKYSNIIDGIFFLLFLAEWMTTWYVTLVVYKDPKPQCLSSSILVGFSSIAWRTILQMLIVQRWYIRCIAPICAIGLVMGYTIKDTGDNEALVMSIIKGLTYIFYLMGIFYLESKVNWTLLLSNIQQDKWIKINEFILNNIPEKIAILDHNGEILYVNDFLKEFVKQCNFSQDTKKMFREVKYLQRQSETVNSMNLCLTEKGLLDKPNISSLIDHETEKNEDEKISCLENLIKNFQIKLDHTTANIEERSLQVFRGKLKLENSSEKTIEIKISRITQDSKHYIVLILQDTTHRDLIATLESNNRYKDHLLASVSHELRTPLNGTINLVDAAISTPELPSKIREDLLMPALKSSKFLLHLINDILDMSQITMQKLRLSFQSRDLKETLLDCVQLVELSAKKKKIDLRTFFDPMLPDLFCTDHTRLSQIVLNLLNNSIKFTQEGIIKLVVETIEDSSRVRVTVEDSGIGMTEDDIGKLFTTYTQIEYHGRKDINPTGVGLGLNIAYNLARLLGPSGNKGISVNSVPEKGSVFSFILVNKDINPPTLSRRPGKSESSADEASQLTDHMMIDIEPTLDQKMLTRFSTKSMRRLTDFGLTSSTIICNCPKILAVDDDPFNMLAYESIMQALNVKIDEAYSGKSAIEKLLERGNCGAQGCKNYRVIFMDQEMPEMNGCETVKEIRKMEKQRLLPQITIVGCTGNAGPKEIQEFVDSGIDQYIQKPIQRDVIKNVLEKFIL